MLFNSLGFLFFLPAVFILYWILPKKYRNIALLLMSYYFYFSCNAKYTLILIATTAVTYFAGLRLSECTVEKKKKAYLVAGIIITAGILAFFKYFDFISVSITDFFNLFGLGLNEFTLKLVQPIGISFYTFQSISYIADVYKGKTTAEKNPLLFALYISFFPQIISGPIARTNDLLPQFKEQRDFDYDNAALGLRIMLWGYFKKLIVADTLGRYVDLIYANVPYYFGMTFIVASLMYTFQIYCDFSGYSEIALGTAKLFNIDLSVNFKASYLSRSVKEFWSRWHISLSTWFRDYVYIPLGGSRCSQWRTNLNLVLTFLVSGLWHGANWTFIFWGGLHGLYQVGEKYAVRLFKGRKGDKPKEAEGGRLTFKTALKNFLLWLITFNVVSILWIFFRASSIQDALFIVTHLHNGVIFHFAASWEKMMIDMGLNAVDIWKLAAFLTLIMVYDFFSLKRDLMVEFKKLPVVPRWLVYTVLTSFIIVLRLYSGIKQSFIYFNF